VIREPGRHRLLILTVTALAVLLVATGAWLFADGSVRRDAQRAGPDAVEAARASIVAMGTYRPETADVDLPAARERLTGEFLDDYTQLIQTVVIPSAQQKRIASVVTVPAASVVSAEPDRVVVLAFVDQTLTVGTQPPSANPSRYRVTMEKVDGRWLIAGFDQI
jgi:Mce-associated membrane protein